jgi:Ran GTPase-activating protein (RanGAP) involved in mRNA processing and transport
VKLPETEKLRDAAPTLATLPETAKLRDDAAPTPATVTPDTTPLETPAETRSPSPRSEASPRCSEERILPDEGSRLGLFDFPHTVVASFLDHGEIVRVTYVSTAAKASYTCENNRLLCPWLVYSKDTKADPEELVKRISLANVLAVRFIGTRLGVDTLKQNLKTNRLTQVERFSAKGCAIHAYDMKMFEDVFKSGTIRLLNLEKNLIGNDVVEKLVSTVLLKNESIDTLNIRFNKVSNDGARALAELSSHPSLTIMNLKVNCVGLDGATALANSLEKNRVLKVLNLRSQCPKLPAAAAFPFADALRVNTTLTRLKLRRNKIDCAGAKALADALSSNSNSALLELDVQQCSVKAEGAAALNNMLLLNNVLEIVYAGGNPFTRGEALEAGPFEQLDRRFELAIVDDF